MVHLARFVANFCCIDVPVSSFSTIFTHSSTHAGGKQKYGRPMLTNATPALINVIETAIATFLPAMRKDRQNEKMQVVGRPGAKGSLDKLHEAVKSQGWSIGRSTLYTYLLPKRASSIEARRHHELFPVRFLRPRNVHVKLNVDGHYAAAQVGGILC